MDNFGKDDQISAFEAKSKAQNIAFAPMVFQAAMALRDLGVLEVLRGNRRHGLDAEFIANELGLPLYGIRVLLEAGLGAEIVYLVDGRFCLTKTGYFILTDKLTQVNMNFVADVCYQPMNKLQDSIVKGQPVGLKELGPWSTIYEGLTQLPDQVQESWFEFDHFYSDSAFPDVLPLVFKNNPLHIVDVGANTGKWAKKCLEYDDTVHMTILDLPKQLDRARDNLEQAGFEGRFNTVAIDLLRDGDDFPSRVDVIWMSQFLACFSESQIVKILNRARSGMDEKSTLYILEAFWDLQQFKASAFSLVNTSLYFACIANGNSKLYHSDEMKACAELAGLKLHKQTDGIGRGHTLLEYTLTNE
jgi:hypothetical protein